MKHIKILLIVIVGLINCKNVSAQIIPEWATTYVANYPSSIDQRDMVADKDGNTYVLGVTTDTAFNVTTVILKYNSFGQFQWIQQYDSINYFTMLAVDDFGNSYILAHSNSNSLLTIKYNTQGVFQWVKSYTSSTNYCWPSDIITDDSSNVYITGTSHNNNFVTIKYNALGVLIWATLDAQAMGQAHSRITLDNHKNVYIAVRGNDSINAATSNTIKYNSAGIKQWENIYMSNFNPGFSGPVQLKFAADGFIYLLASNNNQNNGQSDYAVVKYDTLGNQIWNTTYSFTNYYDSPQALTIDKTGNVYVTGSIWPTGGTVDSIATIKISKSGAFEWKRTYSLGYDNNDEASAIAIDSLGYIFVVGKSSDSFNHENFITLKYDSLGNEIWAGRYHNTNYSSDLANSLSLDKFGNVYISGTSYDVNSSGILTIKYSNAVEIQELSNNSGNIVNIYPVPTNGIIIVSSKNDFNKMELLSITGQVLLSETATGKNHQLQLQNFAEGIYFVRITTYNGLSVTKKIVVNR